MKSIWKWIRNNPNRAMFLVPIILVAGISISHVVCWYDMANPISWAIYLSVAIEIGAMTALVAATNKIKGGVWFMFGLVTFIQMIGNVFYSYVQIDATGELFRNWVELTGPVWELVGTEVTDIIGLKRWLAFLEGGFLPLISLTSLHFFVNYEKVHSEKKTDKEEYFNKRNKHIEKMVSEREEKIAMSIPNEKEFNKPYPIPHVDDVVVEEEFDEDHATDMVMNRMVEELMEKEGHETIGDLIESLDHAPEDGDVVEVPIRETKEESITEEVVNEIEESAIDNQTEEDKTNVIDLPIDKPIVDVPPSPIQNRVVNNPPPKKKAGIDRIT